jgi:NAD(P)-dependent dehydrogenase (short-subunit alcohol dehydrogenase family)
VGEEKMTAAEPTTGLDAGLEGRRVLVTAGAAGIGLAIVQRLLAHRARVFVCDVAEPVLDSFAKSNPQAGVIKADVSSEADVDRMFAAVRTKLGGLDVLVNNAGIAGPTGAVEDIDPAEWRRCIDIDLTGQFLCARRAVPMLKAVGGGSIINISSAAGRHGYAYRTPYSSAKFGIIGFTQSLAKELGPANIRVNAILPGIIEGPRMERVIRDRAAQLDVPYDVMEKAYLERVSLRRMTSPHDIAAMIAFLVSDAGINISGQSIGVDGNVETL